VPMTMVVTNGVEDRYRGFLSSLMLEVAAGVYVSPKMSKGVGERMWKVLAQWHGSLMRGTLVMIWPQNGAPGDLQIGLLGEPLKAIVDVDGVFLTRLEPPACPH